MRQCRPGRSAGARGSCLAGTPADPSSADDGDNHIPVVEGCVGCRPAEILRRLLTSRLDTNNRLTPFRRSSASRDAVHEWRSRIQAESLDGVWASEGYGLLVEIQRDNLTTHEITAISCIPSWVAKRTAKTANETVFTGEHRVIRFPNRPTTDTTRMHVDGTASDILLQRTSERTGRCGLPTDNTPQANYAIFWQTFRENYPFFELHHMHWSALDKKLRPQVRPATKPEELFRFLRQMIEPLHDAHTGIAATDIKQSFDGWRPDPNHLEEEEWKKALEIIDSKYVRSSLRSFCNDRLQYGMLRGSIGYLRITTFYDYVDKEGYVNGLGALQSALESAGDSKASFFVFHQDGSHVAAGPLMIIW